MYTVSGEKADLYSFLVMGPVTLILGEIVPKAVFRSNAVRLAPWLARPLLFSQRLFGPLLAMTTLASRFALKIALGRKEVPATVISRDEIVLITRISERKLKLDRDERKMIDRIFEFKTSNVEVAMKPLAKIAAVSDDSTLEKARQRIAETGYSRLPVYHDRIYNIIGVVSAFDIMRMSDLSQQVAGIMTSPCYVPNTKKNSRLLKEMQESGVNISVVVDEYGAAVGIVTIEDLLEEIVGEIEDEYDNPVKSYEKLDDGRYIIDGAMEIDRINEELGLDLPTGDYETLSGLINELMERIPKKNARLAMGNYLLTTLDASDRRVKSVEIIDLGNKNVDHTGSDSDKS